MLVWKVSQLVFPNIAAAQDAHHLFPFQIRYLVADDGSKCGRTRWLHHESRPVEVGHSCLDLFVVYKHNTLHVTVAQVKGKGA